MFLLLYRAGEHSHHSYSTIHYVCWGFLHSQLHCGVRYSSSSEVDGIRWEPSGHKSSKQWCNSGWASDQWKQNLSVTEVSCTPYISGRPVHLPVCCEFTTVSENSHKECSCNRWVEMRYVGSTAFQMCVYFNQQIITMCPVPFTQSLEIWSSILATICISICLIGQSYD